MRSTRHSRRKRLLLVVAVGLLGAQAAVAGLHLACHAGTDPASPIHACAVCAYVWLNPAAPASVLELSPPRVTAVFTSAVDQPSSSAPLVWTCVRAPPAAVS